MNSFIKYPYLPPDRQIYYVPKDNPFMQEAEKAQKIESTDNKNPIGCVLVKDGKILEKAGNRSKITNPKLIELHKKYCLRRLLHIPSGKGYFLCPGCATSKNHAESTLISKAQKNKIETKDADIYLFGHWWCCKPCWDTMIKAGIKNVYLVEKAWELFKR